MANLLINPNFAATPALPTLLIGTGHAGTSAAGPNWLTWNNSGPGGDCAYVSTAIIPLKTVNKLIPVGAQPQCQGLHDFLRHPPDTDQVLEVCTNGSADGIDQVFNLTSQSPMKSEARVWVFVLRGSVTKGTGPVGTPTASVKSTKTYEWEELRLLNPNPLPAVNAQLIIYSDSADGAWFFIAQTSVVTID